MVLSGVINMAVAATISVTADYTPAVSAPGDTQFTNTSKETGYCLKFPAECRSRGWHSFATTINFVPLKALNAGDSITFKMPSAWRDVVLTNTSSGETRTLRFAINGVGALLNDGFPHASTSGWESNWNVAPQGCSSGSLWEASRYNFSWLITWGNRNDTTPCSKTNTIENRGFAPWFTGANFVYLLEAPNPVQMSNGTWLGSLSYRVAGAGADINLGGDNYTPAPTTIDINFTFTVLQELTVSSQDTALTLHACHTGKICSESASLANWERAWISNIPPVLTGKSEFTIASTGAFTVHLSCEYIVGDDCGIQSNKTSQTVPLKAMLTLPGNIADRAGRPVQHFMLKNSKDPLHAFFSTTEYIPDGRKGHLHFEVAQRDVEAMQQQAPDNYHGMVTVWFDPHIWDNAVQG